MKQTQWKAADNDVHVECLTDKHCGSLTFHVSNDLTTSTQLDSQTSHKYINDTQQQRMHTTSRQ